MPTQKFLVRGLSRSDERVVEDRVRSMTGVLYAAANHQDQCLEAEFEDDLVTPAEICAALREVGYTAEPAG